MRELSLLVTGLVLTVGGCARPTGGGCTMPLSPGRDMQLAYRVEMHMDGVGTSVEKSFVSGENGKEGHWETINRGQPYTSTEWAEMELAVRVAAAPRGSALRTTMTILRAHQGDAYRNKGEKSHEEQSGYDRDSPRGQNPDLETQFSDAKFIAVLDPCGRLIAADIEGEHWSDRKQELAQAIKNGASAKEAALALAFDSPGIFPALEDALAYLPPPGVRPGQSWKVRRELVPPYHAYEFYMLTNGCSYSEEDSTCTVKSVKASWGQPIATISIRGRQIPHDPEKNMPHRVKSFDLTGELEVNLHTGQVRQLRLETVPAWVKPEDESFKAKLVYVISLN